MSQLTNVSDRDTRPDTGWLVSLAIPAGIVTAFLLVMIALRNSAETAVAGFLVILIVFGDVIAAGGQWLVSVFPYAGVAIGAGMAILGVYLLLTHRTIGIMAASRVAVSPQRNLRNVFMYGFSYALGSLSCTLPIFLLAVGSSLASGDLVASLVQFVGYGLGMVAVTIGAALFRGVVATWLRRLVPYVHRMSAMFLVGAGAYLVYYWLFITGSFG